MQILDALQTNATGLAIKATELCRRIDTLRAARHSATATSAELLKTCYEIGRLNDAITDLLREPQTS